MHSHRIICSEVSNTVPTCWRPLRSTRTDHNVLAESTHSAGPLRSTDESTLSKTSEISLYRMRSKFSTTAINWQAALHVADNVICLAAKRQARCQMGLISGERATSLPAALNILSVDIQTHINLLCGLNTLSRQAVPMRQCLHYRQINNAIMAPSSV